MYDIAKSSRRERNMDLETAQKKLQNKAAANGWEIV